MQSTSLLKYITPLFIVFIFINCLLFAIHAKLAEYNVDAKVVFGANCILFVVSVLCIAMHCIAMKSPNPNVMIRSIMLSTLIKLLVFAIATFVYVFITGKNKSVYAIICSMGLYFIYTFIEVRIALKLNKSNGNK